MAEALSSECLKFPDDFFTLPSDAQPMFSAHEELAEITKLLVGRMVVQGGQIGLAKQDPRVEAAQRAFDREEYLYGDTTHRPSAEAEVEVFNRLYKGTFDALVQNGYTTTTYSPQAWFHGRLEDGRFGLVNIAAPGETLRGGQKSINLRLSLCSEEPAIVPYILGNTKICYKLADYGYGGYGNKGCGGREVRSEATYSQYQGRPLPVRMSKERMEALGHLVGQLGTELAPPVGGPVVLDALKKYGGRRIDAISRQAQDY